MNFLEEMKAKAERLLTASEMKNATLCEDCKRKAEAKNHGNFAAKKRRYISHDECCLACLDNFGKKFYSVSWKD